MFYHVLEPSNRSYNFYKDSNITEAIACVDVMKKLEQRVQVELEQWPEHAVLNDVSLLQVSLRFTLLTLINFLSADSNHQPRSRLPKQLTVSTIQQWSSDLTSKG